MAEANTQEVNGNAESAGTLEDFFASLEPNKKSDEHPDAPKTAEELQKEVEQLKVAAKNAKAGQSGTHKEYLRLQAELDEAKQELGKYKNDTPKQPADIFEALSINKDEFVFNPEDLKNPSSDSSRYMRAMVAMETIRVNEKQRELTEKQSNEQNLSKQFADEKKYLMKEYNLTEEQFNEWITTDSVKNLKLDLKTAWSITHQEELDKKRIENALKEYYKKKMEQKSQLDNLPPFLVGIKGSNTRDPSGAFINSIKESAGFNISNLGDKKT